MEKERILYHIARIINNYKKIDLCAKCRDWSEAISCGLFWYNVGHYTKVLKVVDYLPDERILMSQEMKLDVQCPHCQERFIDTIKWGHNYKSCWFCEKEYRVHLTAQVYKVDVKENEKQRNGG